MAAVALFAVWQIVSSRPIHRDPGEIAADDPLQSDLEAPQTLTRGDFQVVAQARFSAEVRVLGRERYRLGALADVSPLDIAVGWGPMSDSAVLADIDIWQSGRFYFWHYDDEPPIPTQEIESHSANWHLVPANDGVWRKLQPPARRRRREARRHAGESREPGARHDGDVPAPRRHRRRCLRDHLRRKRDIDDRVTSGSSGRCSGA